MDGIAEEQAYPTPYANSSLLPLLLMSLAMQKHTPTTKPYMRAEYDYIVVGAGSGGSTVASRLSEESHLDVLVLEAGKSPPRLTDVPAIAPYFIGSDIDWNYITAPQKHTARGVNNSQIVFPLGKTIGGSSIFNALLSVRGNRRNYDDWAAQGATGWSYKEVLPYFKKLEKYRSDIGDPGYHGYFGPVTMEHPKYKPKLRRAVLDSADEAGIPILDSNGRFQRGFYDFTMTARDGQRCSAAKAYLVPAEDRPNLDIIQKAFVTKVLIKHDRSTGVEVDYDGKTYHIKARKEVIVSAGGVNTAKLLMLSGIGPKKHLEQMQIPVVADLPVGLNLQDHWCSVLSYTISNRITPFISKLIDPHNIRRYIKNRTGPLSSARGVTNIAFLTNNRSASVDALPDQQLYFLEALTPPPNQTSDDPVDTYIWCFSQVLNPKSRGSVTLSSANPYDPPIIDPNYFEQEQDIIDMVEGLKQCNEILSGEAPRKLDVTPTPLSIPGCEQFVGDIDAYFRCLVQYFVFTVSHPVGTARMGSPSDPTSVVDPQLRVIGVQGLRVVDASVMPVIPSGNTNVPTIMVAEKAADIIKKNIKCH